MHGRIYLLAIVPLAALCGCTEVPAPATQDDPPTVLGQSFNPAATGTIRGCVLWDGDAPSSEETLVRAIAFNPRLHLKPANYSTPHVPVVNKQNHGVENAVVFLRGIDSRRR